MTHGLTFWGSETRNITNNRLGYEFSDIGGCALLSVAPDFSDHDNGIGFWVILESL